MNLSIKEKIKNTKTELSILQRKISEKSLPVLIMLDGFSSAGIGDIISELIQEMDPRHFKVHVFHRETETELRKPKLWRFWNKFPAKGKISIFDKSYYSSIFNEYKLDKKLIEREIKNFKDTEKMLIDDGFILFKFFFDLNKKEQKNRLEKLKKSKVTRFRVSDFDIKENQKYDKYKKHFDEIIEKSNFKFSPWIRVDSDNLDKSTYIVLSKIKERLEQALKDTDSNKEYDYKSYDHCLILDNVELNTPLIKENDYNIRLTKLQKKAKTLAYKLYVKKIPTILVFEGWDAAGKGGAIKRLLKKIDPRGYEVVPISAPSTYDKSLHYLSRFYRHIPKTGHITLFDRSWYGRVMVERIEGFAKEHEWKRAFDEINSFENSLSDWGAMVIKYFIHIDKQTQLERFEERQKNPLKQYKITEEDWRNREKWDSYYLAISEMIKKTDKKNAPWVIVEGNDKRYARLKVLENFVNYAEIILSENKTGRKK